MNAAPVYLPDTPFAGPLGNGYSVGVTAEGVRVCSECCADVMSVGTARALHEALGRYLADHQLRSADV